MQMVDREGIRLVGRILAMLYLLCFDYARCASCRYALIAKLLFVGIDVA